MLARLGDWLPRIALAAIFFTHGIEKFLNVSSFANSFKLPLVVRFQGTNAKEGKDKINNSDLGLISIDDFTKAAKKVVELAKG